MGLRTGEDQEGTINKNIEFEHKQISLEASGYLHSPRSKPMITAIFIIRAQNRGHRLSS